MRCEICGRRAPEDDATLYRGYSVPEGDWIVRVEAEKITVLTDLEFNKLFVAVAPAPGEGTGPTTRTSVEPPKGGTPYKEGDSH